MLQTAASQAMPETPQPNGPAAVEPRREGRNRNGGGGGGENRQPPKRVAETYQETTSRLLPDDRITILGIPIDQISSSTQAALAGLVAENATLRSQVRRLETRIATTSAQPLLERDAFMARLGELTAGTPGPDLQWILFLIHVETFEDIRRSSGLLAANSVLADVAQRLREQTLLCGVVEPQAVPMLLTGLIGGLSLAALVSAPSTAEPIALAHQVRDGLCANGYDVAGLSMALAIRVAGGAIGVGESPLLAVGRVDHITRGLNVAA